MKRSTSFMRSQRRAGVVAALVHRLSGLALTVFLPAHFLALGAALSGAKAFERFMNVTNNPVIKVLEVGLVTSLAVHLACGLRLLAIEFLNLHERTAVTIAICFAFALACGLLFLLNVQMGSVQVVPS
ncbi:MAG: succinate dehydrogenase [Acidocella sp.]|nr:succinate dehydrogenase [Acidocella sp.]